MELLNDFNNYLNEVNENDWNLDLLREIGGDDLY